MTPEIITVWASIIIALVALFVAVWQGYLMRKHNRLSLRPHLTFLHKLSDQDPRFFLEIQNNGVGPAEIRQFRVFLDSKPQEHFEPASWIPMLSIIGLKGRTCGTSLDSGEFIAAGQKLQMLKYDSGNEPLGSRQIRQALQRIMVQVTYRSVYGESYETSFCVRPSLFDCYETGSPDL